MKVAVIGVGYVGSVTAAGIASLGHDVMLFDRNIDVVRRLLAGHAQYHEPGLRELIAAHSERLKAAASYAEAISGTEVAMICVNTPDAGDGSIDLSFVRGAVGDIASAVGADRLAIVIRSTVVPGTTMAIDRSLLEPLRKHGRAVAAVANPEFLREGRAVFDFMNPDRHVIGAETAWAGDLVADLYSGLRGRVLRMSSASAELAKYANNALLATLVSFSNEMGNIAEAVEGADVVDSLRAVHADRRWSETEEPWSPGILAYLWPGCGYGGSCLPKDVKALEAEARSRGVVAAQLTATDSVNARRIEHVADQVVAVLPTADAAVCVLGTAFKAGTKDERASPGVAIATELERRGVRVVTYDPLLPSAVGVESLDAVLARTQVWVVTTLAPEFEDLSRRAHEYGTHLVDARRRYRLAPHVVGPGRAAMTTPRRDLGI